VALDLTRGDVLGFRVRAQQLDRAAGTLSDTAVLDLACRTPAPTPAAGHSPSVASASA
jgi:hypothetical protein